MLLFRHSINSLHPKISLYILHTALDKFLKVLVRRIRLPIKSFFRWWSFPLFSWRYYMIQGCYWRGKFDTVFLDRNFLLTLGNRRVSTFLIPVASSELAVLAVLNLIEPRPSLMMRMKCFLLFPEINEFAG